MKHKQHEYAPGHGDTVSVKRYCERDLFMLQECAFMAANLVADYGDEFLPIFECTITELETAHSNVATSNEMREKALNLSHSLRKIKGKERPCSATSASAHDPGHLRNPLFHANAPSNASPPWAALLHYSSDPQKHV